jgi:hypothetical protein
LQMADEHSKSPPTRKCMSSKLTILSRQER